MITVVNKRFHTINGLKDVYIGRTSVLGNPYSHLESYSDVIRVATRQEAIEYFEALIFAYFDAGDNEITRYFYQLAEKAKSEDLFLVCHCKHPKREVACHGDIIKQICELLNNENYKKKNL